MSEFNTELNSGSAAEMLAEAFKCVENGKWSEVESLCARVLEQEPENAGAFFAKAMAAVHCAKKEALSGYFRQLSGDENYQNAIKFADDELKAELEGYLKDGIYDDALKTLQAAKVEAVCRLAAETFESLNGWKDADARCAEALDKAEALRKDQIYAAAAFKAQLDYVFSLEEAVELFESIPGWKDADEQLENSRKKLAELVAAEAQAAQEAAQKAAAARKVKLRKIKKWALALIIVAALAGAAIAIIRTYKTVIIPNRKYNEAMAFLENNQYEEAHTIFVELGDFKDASEQVRKIQWEGSKVGDTLVFGNYEQEEVEWLILAKENNRVLVISKYIVDCRAFNEQFEIINWESSWIRNWLNSYFIENAFSEDERAIIEETQLENPDSAAFGTKGCETTSDRIFLLSIDEADKYFSSDEARANSGTAFARSRSLYVAPDGNSWWWLRSPGSTDRSIAFVDRTGMVDEYGFVVGGSVWYGIRPAMWLNLG